MPGKTEVSLTTRMRLVQLEVGDMERRVNTQGALLDLALEIYNDVIDWVTNTDQAVAAAQVNEILEKHMKKAKATSTGHSLAKALEERKIKHL